jgi:hypothetical protein
MIITLADGHLVSQMTGQGTVPLIAQSETTFVPNGIDAAIDFSPDQLTLHQGGRDMTMKRLGDAEAKKATDAAAAMNIRYKNQTAAPGSEAALRTIIEGLRQGKPNYDQMSERLAAATRQQLTQLQPMVAGLGALQSIEFTGVGPGGADIYRAKFEKGALEYRIWMGADGKIESANVRRGE